MMTAMILPAETFSNVEITNGQIISDGNNDIAVGVGFPGLAESLKLQDVEELKDVDFPDYAELTADVKDFSLAMTATVATTGLLDDLDLADVNSTEDIEKADGNPGRFFSGIGKRKFRAAKRNCNFGQFRRYVCQWSYSGR